jgi:hypothetical protein
MPDPTDLRLPGSGLHPNHFAAVRTEVLRTGARLTDEQLLDLTDALQGLICQRGPVRRPDA